MRKKLKIAALAAAIFIGISTAAGCAGPRQWGEGIKVLATTTMLADLTQQIGGEKLSVIGLMRVGIDPHSYDPSAGDSKLLQDAQIIIYNGLHLESRLADLLQKNTRAYAVSDGIPQDKLLQAEDDEGGAADPHIWFDISLWEYAAREVARVLCDFDGENAGYYNQNLDGYLQELTALNQYIQQKVDDIAEDKRILITAHDAFRYFGEAYGFRVEGIQGMSTLAGYGINRINELINIIVTNKIPAVFLESSVPEKNARALINGVKNHPDGFDVEIGGELYSDSIGVGTYIESYTHNIDTIHSALKK